MAIHILPVNDLKEHEERSTCECCPTLSMENNEMMFIHHSYDGREKKEDTLEYDWVELSKDFPKAFNKMSSWVRKNRFNLTPTHIELKPCQYHKGTKQVSKLCGIPVDKNFLEKFFSDVLGRNINEVGKDIGYYFEEYENKI